MHQKRILAVHDISCVGRCSLTVALPIISSVGIECSVLPTAVLSTHTGGFQGFTYRDLTEDIDPIREHWMSLGLKMDAVYTGFLGSFDQIDLVCKLLDDISSKDTKVYVDPVMADKGKLYSVFGPDFPAGMRKLCEKAHVIIPNLTELTLMLDEPYVEGPYTQEYIDGILERARVFGTERIVITGVSFEEGMIGAVYMDYTDGKKGCHMRPEIPGYFHGTGDVFGSALVSACESGLTLDEAVCCAVDFTVDSIIATNEAGDDVKYGVRFEENLYAFVGEVLSLRDKPALYTAVNDEDLKVVESLANIVWKEAYEGVVSSEQIEYMLDRYQSLPALQKQLKDGYRYDVMAIAGWAIGYCGYVALPDQGHVFLSKLYLIDECRGRGHSRMFLDSVIAYARSQNLGRIRLTVNRDNTDAIEVYNHLGFKVIEDVDTDIGSGFFMNDHVMELVI